MWLEPIREIKLEIREVPPRSPRSPGSDRTDARLSSPKSTDSQPPNSWLAESFLRFDHCFLKFKLSLRVLLGVEFMIWGSVLLLLLLPCVGGRTG